MIAGSISLALAWAALQGEMTLATLVTGCVLGYLILALLRRSVVRAAPASLAISGPIVPAAPTRSAASRIAHAAGLAAYFAWELVVANIKVAIDVIRPRTAIQPAVLAIPLDVTSDGAILLLSMLINITPGSVTIDLSEDRRTLYVHVMHMTSAEASRREIKNGFERRIKLLLE
jgi:multicomponent Na+:H+ antiporter subunit E